jgi:hypothetical protein
MAYRFLQVVCALQLIRTLGFRTVFASLKGPTSMLFEVTFSRDLLVGQWEVRAKLRSRFGGAGSPQTACFDLTATLTAKTMQAGGISGRGRTTAPTESGGSEAGGQLSAYRLPLTSVTRADSRWDHHRNQALFPSY